jgi:hypothetical protein
MKRSDNLSYQALSGLPLLAIAAVLPWFVQPSTYWRDGPEFILSAVLLDISHPPGAPTYSQLVNPLTWLPIGPLAARVHLGSVLIICALAIQLLAILRALGCSAWFTFAALSLLPFLPGVMHQALTAEVYALATVFIIAMLHQLILFANDGDPRRLFWIALLAGIGSGAHLIVGLVGATLALFTLIFAFRRTAKATVPVFVCVVVGLGIWGYLPARATDAPPLNSGAPATIERFWKQVSNARDRDLRPKSGFESFHLSGGQLLKDTTRLADYAGWPFLALAAAGFIALVISSPFLGGAFTATLGVVWGLFAGWDFAPFTIVSTLLLIASTVGLSRFSERMPKSATPALAVVALTLLLFANSKEALSVAASLSHYDTPAEAGRAALEVSNPGAVSLVEPSYFLVSYMQAIENFRADVTVLYQPALQWPEYFSPVIGPFDSTQLASISEFFRSVPAETEVTFEATAMMNPIVSQIARCSNESALYINRPLPSGIGADCAAALLARFPVTSPDAKQVNEDQQHYREMYLSGVADLLLKQENPAAAEAFLAALCDKFGCSEKIQSGRQSILQNAL